MSKGGAYIYVKDKGVAKEQKSLREIINCVKSQEKLIAKPPSIQIIRNDDKPPKIEPKTNEIYEFVLKNGKSAKYELKERLASGSYGAVYWLELINDGAKSDAPEFLTIKFPNNPGDLDADIIVLNKIQGKDPNKLIIDSCHFNLNVESESVDFLLMERMDGSLESIISDLKNDELVATLNISDQFAINLNIIIQLAYAYDLLFKNELIYTDSKLGNVLYRIQQPGQLEIFLSDYGGACPVGLSEGLATYPYIYDDIAAGFIPHVADMIYGLFIILLQLITLNNWILSSIINGLHHSNIDDPVFKKKCLIHQLIILINSELKETSVSMSRPIRRFLLDFTDFVVNENMLRKNENQLWTDFLNFLLKSYQTLSNNSEFALNHLMPVDKIDF